MIEDKTPAEEKPHPPHQPHSGIDSPQPGARQEMPYSPPRQRFVYGGLAVVAVLFAVAVLWSVA
jgi:hypothetical protein